MNNRLENQKEINNLLRLLSSCWKSKIRWNDYLIARTKILSELGLKVEMEKTPFFVIVNEMMWQNGRIKYGI